MNMRNGRQRQPLRRRTHHPEEVLVKEKYQQVEDNPAHQHHTAPVLRNRQKELTQSQIEDGKGDEEQNTPSFAPKIEKQTGRYKQQITPSSPRYSYHRHPEATAILLDSGGNEKSPRLSELQ